MIRRIKNHQTLFESKIYFLKKFLGEHKSADLRCDAFTCDARLYVMAWIDRKQPICHFISSHLEHMGKNEISNKRMYTTRDLPSTCVSHYVYFGKLTIRRCRR